MDLPALRTIPFFSGTVRMGLAGTDSVLAYAST